MALFPASATAHVSTFNGTQRPALNDLTSVPLLVHRTCSPELDRVVVAFTDLFWLGQPMDEPPEHPGLRRIATDLELPIGDRSSTSPVRKATCIYLGHAHLVGDRVLIEIAWQSATFAPLFPVFAGELRISADDIALDGRYAPQFGPLGLLLDETILHFVARRTAAALLARLAKEFES